MNNFEDVLAQILETLGRPEGNEQFIDDFVTIVNMQAMVSLVESLPDVDQKKVADLFVTIPDGPGKEETIFGPYFSRARRREVLLETMKTKTRQYVIEYPGVSTAQRKKCLSLLDVLRC